MHQKSDTISYPPRGLSREAAARYVGVGATLFDEMVSDGRMPKPIKVNTRSIWDRIEIDSAFSDLNTSQDTNPIDIALGHRGKH